MICATRTAPWLAVGELVDHALTLVDRIEVKARLAGAKDFFVTHNEVLTGKNAVPRYRLALVKVDPRGTQHDEVRYLDDPFAGVELGDFEATGHRGDWAKTWAKGSQPF